MKNITMYFSILLFVTCSPQVEKLKEVADTKLVYLLNNMRVLAESAKPPVSVRIYSLREQGECDGGIETCPKEEILIAVSTFDEAPDQKLYILPKSYAWKFIRWVNIPKEESSKYFIVIELEGKFPNTTLSNNAWELKTYEISINPWNGYIKEISRR